SGSPYGPTAKPLFKRLWGLLPIPLPFHTYLDMRNGKPALVSGDMVFFIRMEHHSEQILLTEITKQGLV
ncbi:hypothetical protein GHAL_1160, partial [Hafnia alvei ATCC 13337]